MMEDSLPAWASAAAGHGARERRAGVDDRRQLQVIYTILGERQFAIHLAGSAGRRGAVLGMSTC